MLRREKSANLEYEIFMRIREEAGNTSSACRLWHKRWHVDVLAELCCGRQNNRIWCVLSTAERRLGKRSACQGKGHGAKAISNSILLTRKRTSSWITGPMSGNRPILCASWLSSSLWHRWDSICARPVCQFATHSDAIFTASVADDLVSGQPTHGGDDGGQSGHSAGQRARYGMALAQLSNIFITILEPSTLLPPPSRADSLRG